MPDEKQEDTQYTPKGHKIPVPKKGDFLRDLRKVAKKPSDSGKDRPKQ